MLITCVRCNLPKKPSEFGKSNRTPTGLRPQCKKCRNEEYGRDAERKKAAKRERYKNDIEYRERVKLAAHDYHHGIVKANPEKPKETWQEANHRAGLKYLFKMTRQQYKAKSAAQNDVCLICKRSAEEADPRTKHLSVDHDHSCCPGKHSCGKCIRGLLCSPCNAAIGRLNDSVPRLLAAITYLQSFPSIVDG
jgi:hypothetical protein